MTHAAEVGHAPALDGAGDDAEGPRLPRGRPRPQDLLDRDGIVAVDHDRLPAERLRLACQGLPVLGRGDPVALPEGVAVEEGDDGREPVIGDEVHRLPDLALSRLAVADDAVDRLRAAIDPGGRGKPRRDGEPLSERPGRRVEERKPEHRVGVAVDEAVDAAQGERRSSSVIGRAAPPGRTVTPRSVQAA